MKNDDLLSVLENKINRLIVLIKEKDKKLYELEHKLDEYCLDNRSLRSSLNNFNRLENNYSNIKKLLAFSVKENYLLNKKNEKTKDNIESLINKLDIALSTDTKI